ncbi:MAG: 4Fe-4S binding protein [Veillonella parvula]
MSDRIAGDVRCWTCNWQGGGCISCGHCISVCPTLALDSDMTPRKEQIDITKGT